MFEFAHCTRFWLPFLRRLFGFDHWATPVCDILASTLDLAVLWVHLPAELADNTLAALLWYTSGPVRG
jgi:hypothetical protein